MDVPGIILQEMKGEAMDEYITQTRDLSTLNKLLEVKLALIRQGLHAKFNFDFSFALENMDAADESLQSEVLTKALLLQKDVKSSLGTIREYLSKSIKESNCALFPVFEAVLTVCELENETLELNMETDLICFFKKLKTEARYVFLCKIVPKLNLLTSDKEIDVLDTLVVISIETKDLEILCKLLQITRMENLSPDTIGRLYSLIQQSLNDGNQKFAIYLLNQIWSTENVAHKNYMILLDCVREKQLHLIEPSLPLLDTISVLQANWVTCIYRLFFLHSQNSVSLYAIRSALKSEWLKEINVFREIISYLLRACNKMLWSDEFVEMFEEFGRIARDRELLRILLKNAETFPWNPVAFWLFHKNLFGSQQNVTIDEELIENVLLLIRKLTDKHVRNSCVILLLKYLGNEANRSSLGVIIRFCRFVVRHHFNLLPDFCKQLKRALHRHRNEIIQELNRTDHNCERDCICEMFLVELNENELLRKVRARRVSFLFSTLCETTKDGTNFCPLFFNFSYSDISEEYLLKLIEASIVVLLKPHCSCYTAEIAFGVLSVCKPLKRDLKAVLDVWVLNFIDNRTKMTSATCRSLLDILFEFDSDFSRVWQVIAVMFSTQNHDALPYIFEKLGHLLKLSDNADENEQVLKLFYNQLLSLTKTTVFERCLKYFLSNLQFGMTEYGIMIVSELAHLSNVHACIKSHLTLAMAGSLTPVLINLKPNVVVSVITELFLNGIPSKKEERALAMAYDDIKRSLSIVTKSDNVKLLEIISSLLNSRYGELFADDLIARYKTTCAKTKNRYFQDSLVHIKKQRIIQLLIILESSLTNTQIRKSLVDLALCSMSEESHQPSVRQLMQWLLILLLYKDTAGVQLVFETLKNADRTQVSSISALIVVLYHLTLNMEEEEDQIKVASEMVGLTMGAHFKLRLYSQVCLLQLIKNAKASELKGFINKFVYLEDTLTKMLDSSGRKLEQVLQTDKIFVEIFDPINDRSFETIFLHLPYLNGVPRTELTVYESDEVQFHLEKCNATLDLATHINYYINSKNQTPDGPNAETSKTRNIQRKIVPWTPFEERNENQRSDLIVVATLIGKPANLGGLSRTCETFRVKCLVLENAKVIEEKEFKSLSMSSEKWVDLVEVKEKALPKYLLDMKKNGYCILGAEQTVHSMPLHCFKFPIKTVVLLGNEKEGIAPHLLPMVDFCLEIQQAGVIRSLNVHVAGAIFIWEYFKQHSLNSG